MDLESAHNLKYIITKDALIEAAEDLLKEKAIAVDIEADSMFHFREKVCLIQIATGSTTILVDPLFIDDLFPLSPVFSDKNIRKIFHGADYDIRSLHRDFNFEIENLFDTELACRFLGETHTGLSNILEKRFNIKLNKKYQKKDWSQRPLPESMIEYGAKDVSYLIDLAKELESELIEKGRIGWLAEECELLSKVRINSNSKKHLFMSLRGAGRLDPLSLCVLESLLEMRIKYAEVKDKPLFKIISNDALLNIASHKPKNRAHLKKLRILSSKQLSMFGDEIVDAISSAMQTPKSKLPVYPKKKPPSVNKDVPFRIKDLKVWRDEKATELCLDPSLILNKSLLCKIAELNPENREELDKLTPMRNWQKDEFGKEIVDTLNS